MDLSSRLTCRQHLSAPQTAADPSRRKKDLPLWRAIALIFVSINLLAPLRVQAAMQLPDGIENILGFVPKSNFKCERDGYFGDVDNDCKIFHLCQKSFTAEGRPEWHHWTYACGNQTMFNQLTLTCAFVDEAIPCRHATQFQYLNEVIHRPKEPFLTDADVTSGFSYYSNRIMSDGARARAFEDQQLLAQLGGTTTSVTNEQQAPVAPAPAAPVQPPQPEPEQELPAPAPVREAISRQWSTQTLPQPIFEAVRPQEGLLPLSEQFRNALAGSNQQDNSVPSDIFSNFNNQFNNLPAPARQQAFLEPTVQPPAPTTTRFSTNIVHSAQPQQVRNIQSRQQRFETNQIRANNQFFVPFAPVAPEEVPVTPTFQLASVQPANGGRFVANQQPNQVISATNSQPATSFGFSIATKHEAGPSVHDQTARDLATSSPLFTTTATAAAVGVSSPANPVDLPVALVPTTTTTVMPLPNADLQSDLRPVTVSSLAASTSSSLRQPIDEQLLPETTPQATTPAFVAPATTLGSFAGDISAPAPGVGRRLSNGRQLVAVRRRVASSSSSEPISSSSFANSFDIRPFQSTRLIRQNQNQRQPTDGQPLVMRRSLPVTTTTTAASSGAKPSEPRFGLQSGPVVSNFEWSSNVDHLAPVQSAFVPRQQQLQHGRRV